MALYKNFCNSAAVAPLSTIVGSQLCVSLDTFSEQQQRRGGRLRTRALEEAAKP